MSEQEPENNNLINSLAATVESLRNKRLDRVEAEVSRLRSVVYLLVKDRPDMLRLLGETPPAGDEGRP